ncbi:hypothetical protein FM106_24820 [Brachybacterium faecium]|nr:hypothetical protein FM106_24820 [Brachybacterium faecium]
MKGERPVEIDEHAAALCHGCSFTGRMGGGRPQPKRAAQVASARGLSADDAGWPPPRW